MVGRMAETPTAAMTTHRWLADCAGMAGMLVLAMWLGGATNAWVVTGALQRLLFSLRLWSTRPLAGARAGAWSG
jgi:hypothetical protein